MYRAAFRRSFNDRRVPARRSRTSSPTHAAGTRDPNVTSLVIPCQKYPSFPQRLLVALSVLVILVTFVMPAETRSIEHKRRHQRRQPEAMAQLTKDMRATRHPSVELYKNATRKIMRKLKNTRRFFNQERKELNESKDYRDGMPDWLPAVNFVDIHFHDYKSSRKVGSSIWEKKAPTLLLSSDSAISWAKLLHNGDGAPEDDFAYQMPRLYKSLKEYYVLFQKLRDVEVDFPDDPFSIYKNARQKLINASLQRLYSSIAEVTESMTAVNMDIPNFDISKMKLENFPMKVDATQCLKNDYIVFRGYGNLLNNWYYEFRCPRSKKVNKRCAAYEEKLQEKKDSRRPKNKMS
ncbi:hypothetical protein RR46_13225 [Papilio xuthus]|uniref:Uncharacterized protein n=1 Tax=Papilio xuthus TaxID=66420 RepID=A0A194PSG2_PAPXU|nr:hypothetical protein RR46_13225 [Papilio xuthus]